MITKNGRLKCDICGCFIGENDKVAVTYVPFGNILDEDPPEAEHDCGKCVSKYSEWQKNYAEHQTWIRAHQIF